MTNLLRNNRRRDARDMRAPWNNTMWMKILVTKDEKNTARKLHPGLSAKGNCEWTVPLNNNNDLQRE